MDHLPQDWLEHLKLTIILILMRLKAKVRQEIDQIRKIDLQHQEAVCENLREMIEEELERRRNDPTVRNFVMHRPQ